MERGNAETADREGEAVMLAATPSGAAQPASPPNPSIVVLPFVGNWDCIYSRPIGERRNFTGFTGFYKIYRIALGWFKGR